MNTSRHIRAGWLIDGTGQRARRDVLLRIQNGCFTEITDWTPAEAESLSAVQDLSGCTILPPLIDAHVHLAQSGSTDTALRKKQLESDFPELVQDMVEHLDQLHRHGVYTVRDGGDRRGHTLRLWSDEAISRADVQIQPSGIPWHTEGRYGSFLGRTPEKGSTLARSIDLHAAPCPWIKLLLSGVNSLREYGRQTPPQFSLDELKEVVRVAHRHGKKVMVHANGELPVRLAVEAGCDSIEHGFFMGRENLLRLADTGIHWVPTACTMQAFLALCPEHGDREVVQRTLDHQLEQITLAREMGVRITLGTDAGAPGVLHGKSVREELRLFMEAGMSLEEAIESATTTPAELLALERKIRKGGAADFLVIPEAPDSLFSQGHGAKQVSPGGSPVVDKTCQVF